MSHDHTSHGPYFLTVETSKKPICELESAIPFQAFSVGDGFVFNEENFVIKKIKHFVRDSSDDKDTIHRILLVVSPAKK